MLRFTLMVLFFLLICPQLTWAQEGSTKISIAQVFFTALNSETMDLVDEFYVADAHFVDPLVEFHSRDAIKQYYASAYAHTDEVRFEFPGEVTRGNETFLAWTMIMRAKKLNRGKPIIVDGVSHIIFNDNGKAVYHRDYFDMGQMIYKHVPFLRGAVNFVNTRMKKKHVSN